MAILIQQPILIYLIKDRAKILFQFTVAIIKIPFIIIIVMVIILITVITIINFIIIITILIFIFCLIILIIHFIAFIKYYVNELINNLFIWQVIFNKKSLDHRNFVSAQPVIYFFILDLNYLHT